MADAYFVLPDAFRRPNTALYTWLENAMAKRAVRGMIFVHYLNCDLWQAEAYRFKALSAVPVLVLDLADGGVDHERIRTRVEAFLEAPR